MADGKIDIELNVESKSASTQAKKAVSDISKGIESGLKDVSKAAENVGKNVEKPLKNAADSAKSAFKGVGADAKSSFSGIGDAAKSASSDASSAFKTVPADAKGAFSEVSSEAKSGFDGVSDAAKTAADGATDAFDGLGDQIESEFDGIGDAAESAGDEINGVFGTGIPASTAIATAAIAAVGVETLKLAKDAVTTGMEFDKAMSQVAATMGVSVKEVGELTDFAKQMGESTAFSASQAAEALNYMALAGYDAETSMRVLPTVLNLAAAGNMELAAASDMVTDAQSALGLSLDQTEIMVDQMAKTSSKTNTSVAQLGEAFLTVGGTAKNLAGGTAELSQMLGILADNGIKGAEGGTALRNVILSLSAPTDTAAAKMEELGLAVFDAEGNMRPMPETFADLNAAMEPLTQQDKTDALNTIFNKVDLKSANALLGTSASRFSEVAVAIDDAAGSAEKMANTQLDNLAGDVTLLESATEGFFISVSDKLTPALRQLTQFGTNTLMPFLTGAVKNIDKFAPAILGMALGITTLVTKGKAVKTLSGLFQTLQIKVAGSTTAFKAMTTAEKATAIATTGLNTALKAMQSIAIVAAISAAAAAIAAIAEHMANAKRKAEDFNSATKGLEAAASQVAISVDEETGAIRNLGNAYKDLDLDRIIDEHKQLASSINEVNQNTNSSVGLLDGYAEVIGRLGDKSDLTEEEAAELQIALNGVNEACGTSYELAGNAAEGYHLMADGADVAADAILNLIEKQQMQLRAEAAAENYKNIFSQLQKDADSYADAQSNVTVAQEALNAKLAELEASGYERFWVDQSGNIHDFAAAEQSVLEAYEADLASVGTQMDSTQSALNRVTEQQKLYEMALMDSASDMTQFVAENVKLQSAVQGAGIDLVAFTQSLNEMGLTTEQVTALMQTEGEAGIQGFIAAYQAGGEQLTAWMQEFGANIGAEAQATADMIEASAQEASETVSVTTQQGMQNVTEAISSEAPNAEAAMAGLVDGVDTAAQGLSDNMPQYAQQGVEGATSAINAEAANVQIAAQSVTDRVDAEWSQMPTEANDQARQTMDSLNSGLQAGEPDVIRTADDISKQVADHFSSASADAWWAGRNMAQGMADGIRAGQNEVVQAAIAAVKAANEAAKSAAKESSPSKIWRQIGQFMTLGAAIGITDKKKEAVDATKEVVEDINDAVSELGRVVSDGIILDVKYGGNPLAQLNESMLRGTSALSFAAMAGNTANNYNNSTQNLNFYGDYQSPDVIAREMRMQQRYGLAGEYI